MTVFSAATLLFLVMDPFGNIPFFVSALKDVERKRHSRIILRELFIALAVLVLFLFSGQHILRMLHITESALTAAGGTILFLIAIKMVFPPPGERTAMAFEGEPFIVPLAIPYVAGPSALASVLLIMNQEPDRWREWLLALGCAWLASGVVILSSGLIGKLLGEKILIAIERLMGMVLVAISIQMLMTGIAQFIAAQS